MPNVVESTSWGYRYTLEKGDVVEVGDSSVSGFKAHVKIIRGNKWFSLGLAGGTFVPSLNGLTVSFPFNSNISVNIYPVDPCERLPDGGIEYNVILTKKIAQTTITMNVDWSGITWRKIPALNVEYDQALCVDKWPKSTAPFTITPTQISDATGEVLLTRPEYEVNSYEGTAMVPDKSTSEVGVNKDNGQPITFTNLSQTHLYIHRGQMADALGNTAWVEDINLDQTAKTITFTLPRDWIKTATYPISQVCGVDPAYTQTWASWQSTAWGGSDGVWGDYDTTAVVGADNVVLSLVLSNATAGTENSLGVRANGSSLERRVTLHEAEGGGQTHCRMFVQSDANGIIECYHSDVSDADYFYVSGYWTNVTFIEAINSPVSGGSSGSWQTGDNLLSAWAGKVAHILLENREADVANTLGVRAVGSSLERIIVVHEPEAGGYSYLDMLVKVDANADISYYSSDITNASFIASGYFSSEMDFVEKWQALPYGASWHTEDLSAYLDQDGRVCDFMLTHGYVAAIITLGIRDGDDLSTERSLQEHESENGSGTNHQEFTGFSMSAKTNASGLVYARLSSTSNESFLTGYFKPSATGPTAYLKIVNETLQSSEGFQRARTSYKHIAETEQVSESLRHVKAFFKVIDEVIQVSEGFVRSLVTQGEALLKIINETLQISETIHKTQGFIKSISETVQSSETYQKALSLIKAQNETVQLSETHQKSRGLIKYSDETVQTSEGTYTQRGLQRTVNETLEVRGGSTQTIEVRVAASADDCLRRLTTPFFGLNATYSYAGATDAFSQFGSGLRFTNLGIPQGAAISNAYLLFTCRSSSSGTENNTRISAEAVDNAVTFENDGGAFDTRFANHTTARIDWDNEEAWVEESGYQTPSITSVVQEIVNRPSWNPSNSLVIFHEDFDDRSTHAVGCVRYAYSWDSGPSKAPLLHIEYRVEPEKYMGYTKEANETEQVTESHQKSQGFIHQINETIQVVESFLRELVAGGGAVLIKVINETVQITHSIQKALGLTKTSDETVQVSESLQKAQALKKFSDETVEVTESVLQRKGLIRNILETIQITETFQKARGLLHTIGETVQLVESYVKGLSSGIVKVIDETLQITETIQRTRTLLHQISETVQTSESYQKAQNFIHQINETIQLIENLVREMVIPGAILKIINETIEASETLQKAMGLLYHVNETVQLVETKIKELIIAAILKVWSGVQWIVTNLKIHRF